MSEIYNYLLQYSFLLSLPILVISIILVFKLVSTILKLISTVICIFMLIVSWAYFVEPQLLISREVNIPIGVRKSITLISDTHFGLSKGVNFSTKIANEINKLDNIDMVLWAGDIVENVKEEDFDIIFKPLSTIKYPQYAVLGNHDYAYQTPVKSLEQPTAYSQALSKSLASNNIRVLNNEVIIQSEFNLIGLTSVETKFQNRNLYNNLPSIPNITLVHEGGTNMLLQDNQNTLMLSGHTHCGQVKIPYLSEYLIPKRVGLNSDDKLFEGLYDMGKKGKVFISCGVGETKLPLRLLNPPTIYKINLQ
jgi:uncharacterized protein